LTAAEYWNVACNRGRGSGVRGTSLLAFQGAASQEEINIRVSINSQLPGSQTMDVFGGKEELVDIKIQISRDQKEWLEKMVKEGKIAVPPGGTLAMGSVVSMFIRALLHNAMEQQAAMAREEDDDDE
jgi:hypothetical protein